MKKILKYSIFSLFIAQVFLFSACLKDDDLVTADAKEGGLVNVISKTVPYKVGTSPTLEITLNIPIGPGISSIEVMKVFKTDGGESSNVVLLSSIPVDKANVTSIVEKKFSLVYADLIKDLTLNGNALPSVETDLTIGDSWKITYVSVMEDGRKVLNNGLTNIGVANPYAGKYSRTGLLVHPTAGNLPYEETGLDLVTVDATTLKTLVGYWENTAYILTIKVNADNSVTIGGDVGGTAVTATPGLTNVYDPATKTFSLHYTYNGRLFTETLTAE